MDLRSIKPGLPAADLFGMVHPRTGQPIVPLGYTRDGRAIWPVLGGDGDNDPNDPRFTGEDDDDEDDEEDDSEQDDDEDEPKAKRGKGKPKDDDDDEDDEETYTKAEYDKVRARMRAADQTASRYKDENARLKAQLAKATKGKAKPAEDDDDDEPRVDRAAAEREAEREKALRETRIENAFLRVARDVTDRQGNQIEWHDPEDALAVADRLGLLDDVLDTDGTVDRREMTRALRALAKRKPHLVVVKKASGRSGKDSDDTDADDRRSSAPAMNGKRKGAGKPPDREALAARFPVLNRPSNR